MICETNQILNYGERREKRETKGQAGQPLPSYLRVLRDLRGGYSCKTKPNLGRMGHLGDGAPAKGQICKTNPICRSGPGWAQAGGPHWRGLLSR